MPDIKTTSTLNRQCLAGERPLMLLTGERDAFPVLGEPKNQLSRKMAVFAMHTISQDRDSFYRP